jgi:alkanesulfonate monooxygenase SsuD/methylene tetrahydromethanopterin reductase-like flavin-dependent oxidoreductase (luciferase family)
MKLQFGVFDHMDSNGGSIAGQYSDRLDLVEAYEQLGFRAYHLAEHHFSRQSRAPSPSVFLSAVAQRTRTLRLGPLVYTLCFYPPLRVLEEICMLDQLSGGRLELGIGRGSSPIELGFHGIAMSVADEIYAEAMDVIMQGLRQGHVTHEGKHFQFRGVPLELTPLQRPHPPIWMGVAQPQSAARAAALGANIVCVGRAQDVRVATDSFRSKWAEVGPEDSDEPLLGIVRHTVIAENEVTACEAGRRAYRCWYENRMSLWQRNGLKPGARLMLPESFEEAVSTRLCIVGSPATVRHQVLEELRISGASYFLGHFAFGDLERDEALRSASLFAEIMKLKG